VEWPGAGNHLVFFLGLREDTALAVGRWAVAAAVDVSTDEAAAVDVATDEAAAADVAARRGADASPGKARPLILKPVPALVTVAPL
jgi:hypothetical protein